MDNTKKKDTAKTAEGEGRRLDDATLERLAAEMEAELEDLYESRRRRAAERAKMTELLSSGFADTFRRLHPDAVGAYSWWSYRFNARANNAGWRIDYFIVSDRLADRVKEAAIHPDIHGSDHCPVSVELAL